MRGRDFFASCSDDKQFEEGRALLRTIGRLGARLARLGAEGYASYDVRQWFQVTGNRMGCRSVCGSSYRDIFLTGRQKIRGHFMVFGEAAEVKPDNSTQAVRRTGETSPAARKLSGSPDCLRIHGNRQPLSSKNALKTPLLRCVVNQWP